jgi:hypothetical protein
LFGLTWRPGLPPFIGFFVYLFEGLRPVGVFGVCVAVLGSTMIFVAAPRAEWAFVVVGAVLVIGGGTTALLNRRPPMD